MVARLDIAETGGRKSAGAQRNDATVPPRSGTALRVVWTTPHGRGGSGGMDSITELLTQTLARESRSVVRITPLTTKGRWGMAAGGAVFGFALLRFAVLARRHQVDVLHINVAAYGSAYRKMLLARLAHWFGIPYVVHVHSGRFGVFWDAAGGRTIGALAGFFSNAEAVIVLGQNFADMVTGKLPRLHPKLHVLPNASPARHAAPRRPLRERRIQVTSIGLLGHNKNTMQLIAALQLLAGRGDWQATIAGNGDVRAARAYIGRLGLADRIAVPGWINRDAIQDLLGRTDIFVLPSRSEGMPMAILEALSYGIPVVATPVGAIPDIVRHEKNGLLVPVGDLDALAHALQRLMQDDDLRRVLGEEAARNHRQHHTLERYLARLTHIWEAVHRSAYPAGR